MRRRSRNRAREGEGEETKRETRERQRKRQEKRDKNLYKTLARAEKKRARGGYAWRRTYSLTDRQRKGKAKI